MSAIGTAPPRDELRLALALNGGVSLAVWIGGAIEELDAVRCADTDSSGASAGVYHALLEALQLRVTIDIAAATSAGGMNGPLLAAAVARGNRVEGLRDLWMTLANLGDLMRDTGEPEPLSLLDGDGFVLRNVRERLEGQFTAPRTRAPGRFRLILTGTEIQGIPIEPINDSYGASVPRVEHRLQFRFAAPDAPAGWLPLEGGSVPQIARAARTTSSFPFAFEPSSITGDDFTTGVWTRRGGPVQIDPGKGRWAIDGGVLDNSPIQPVLNEIWDTPTAEGPQRRCIVFVTPYSTEPAAQPPRQAPLSSVLGATFMVPRDVPHVDDLAELADQVQQQRQSDAGDASLLEVPDAELAAVAGALAAPFAHYRRVRALQTAAGKANIPVTNDDLARWATLPDVIASVSTVVPQTALSALTLSAPADWRWSSEHVRSAGLRWRARLAAARRALPAGADAERRALRAQETLIQAAIATARDVETTSRNAAAALVANDAAFVQGVLARVPSEADRYAERLPDALLDALAAGFAMYDGPGAAATANRAAWHDAITAIAEAVAAARAAVAGRPAAAAVLLGQRRVTAQRLLQIEAILQALTSSADVDAHPGVEVEFLRLSTRPLDEHPLAAHRIPSSFAYLYGGQLGHFAGFVRGSWRAHDWMMGRLDGAAAVLNLLLNERRVAEAGLSNADMVTLLHRLEPGTADGLVSNASLPTADELQLVRARFVQVVQSRILTEELPQIRRSVTGEEGWSASTPRPDELTGSAAEVFDRYLSSIDTAGGVQVVVGDELSSPRGSRLVADAAVVSSNVLAGRATGFPAALGAAVGSARGAVRLARFVVRRATGGTLERTLFIVAAAIAGAALAWAVARGTGGASADASTGSPFKETVVAASLTLLLVALILAVRPFANRLLALGYALGAASTLALLVGWIWTGKVQATCAVHTPCGTLGETSFLWAVLGIVALSLSIGWIGTTTFDTLIQWVASVASVAFAVVLALALANPSGTTDSVVDWLRGLPGVHFLRSESGWFLLVAMALVLLLPALTAIRKKLVPAK